MGTRRECCDYCMWYGPVNQDGTMRKHRPATSEDRYGRKVQNRHEDYCQGSRKPYARFGNAGEAIEDAQETTVTDEQPTTARAAADFPKGTRVTSPEGRKGTVNGVDVGRVTIQGHPNYGREYVGVDWDADEKCSWGGRSRPFVDELTIVAPVEADVVETTASQEADEYEPSSEAAIAAARIALTELKTKGWKSNPIYWVGRLEAALEQTIKAIDKQDGCTRHDVKDRRGGRALELGVIPTCEPGITYGAWSESAGGFVYSGVDCATDAANWAADELRQLAKEDDTDKFEILAICPDHEEQPKNGCEECNEEADESETEAAPTLEDIELPSDEADREQAQREVSGPSLDDYATASRIIQSLIPGVRR